MELIRWRSPHGNFGDDLNDWLWDALLPGWRRACPDVALVGVGSILHAPLLPAHRRKLVIGAGVGYPPLPRLTPREDWDVRAVRGPRSAAALGLPASAAVLDPAVLIGDMPQFASSKQGDETLFVPHWESEGQRDWPAICARAGVAFASPTCDSQDVIRRIARAGRVLAESMHAAIIADAFGTPWRAVAIGPQVNPTKWLDWAESLKITLEVFHGAGAFDHRLRRIAAKRLLGRSDGFGPDFRAPVVDAAMAAVAARDLRRACAGPFRLSDRTVLNAAKIRLRVILRAVAEDYGLA